MAIQAVHNPDNTVSVHGLPDGTINWAALLQSIVAALPAILAIFAAFSPAPTPTPVPSDPPPQPKP